MTLIIKISCLSLLTLLLTFGIHDVSAYDSPDFDFQIVDSDALHLPQNDRESIVEALNAVACNFPASPLVDEDLKEKAIAIALALEPLNVNSRNAHFTLLEGKQPPKTAFFQTSVSDVAEKLWASAEKMTGKQSEPEARNLANYLQELSLVLHPSPPPERVKVHARLTDNGIKSWDKFVKLQPEKNPSDAKLKSIFANAKNSRPATPPVEKAPPRKPEVAKVPVPPVPPPVKPKSPEPTPVASGNASEIKLPTVEIPFVARTQATIRNGNLGGSVSLKIRKAKTADEGLFGMTDEIGADRANQMRIVSDPDGFQPSGFENAERFIRQTFPVWPDKMLAEVRFDSSLPSRSSRRLTTADTSLATSLLLYSAFTGKTPLPELVVAGFISDLASGGEASFSVGDEIAEVLDQAKAMEAGFLLIPDSHYDQIVKGAIETRMLEYLFDPQLISYSGWEQLTATTFGENADKRAEASSEFKKIQAVQDKMPLVELSRNEKVRERLTQIVSSYPQHLSARVMLAFGAAPDDQQAIIKDAIRSVDEALAPFITTIASAVTEESLDALDFNEIHPMLDIAERTLVALQTTIAPEVRNYLYLAKEVLNASKTLVSSGSKDSSVARQRLDGVSKAFTQLQMERVALGLERIEADEFHRLRRRLNP